ARRRHPAQGPADPDVCWPDHRRACRSRPLRDLALAAASCLGRELAFCSGAALVCRHLLARRRSILCRFHWRRHAEQAVGTGISRRSARSLSPACLGDVLAGRTDGADGGACGVAREAGAGSAISAGLARTLLDRLRAGADQTAALRAAALPRDRDPHRRRARAEGAVAIVVEEWSSLVVRDPRTCLRDGRRHRGWPDAPAGISGLAIRGCGPHLRIVRMVALR